MSCSAKPELLLLSFFTKDWPSSLFCNLWEEQLQTPKVWENVISTNLDSSWSCWWWEEGVSVDEFNAKCKYPIAPALQRHLLYFSLYYRKKHIQHRLYIIAWTSSTHHPASVSLSSWPSSFPCTPYLHWIISKQIPDIISAIKYLRLSKRRRTT